jgi:hypothetical protein
VADTISDEEHKKFEKSATHENKRSSNGFGGCRMDSERITTTRPTEPGPLPLADGLSPLLVRGCGEGVPADQIDPDATAEGRVMRLKGYGNAIVPELAATFIRSVMDVLLDCQEETER